MNGNELYALVESYFSLGDHRTGTSVDRHTIDWFSTQLRAYTADVREDAYEFPYFACECEVWVDSEPTECLARYYAGLGKVRDSKPLTAAIDAHLDDNEHHSPLANLAAKAASMNAQSAVIATPCPTQSLCAINERPRLDGPLPSVLVPGRYAPTIEHSRVELDFKAHVETRRSSNVLARIGAGPGAPLVVTTPLSGWFGCAGERGTGIAVLLGIVEALAEMTPLVVVGATGHELGYFGGWHYATRHTPTPRAVLHLGSSIAALAADSRSLSPGIQITTNLTPPKASSISATAEALGMQFARPSDPLNPSQWFGESSCWASFGCPMISIAGTHPHFHTPQDSPANATNAKLLETIRDAVMTMAQVLIAT